MTVIYLKVSYDEKELVKSFGAKWSDEKKSWYIPLGIDYRRFYKWMPKEIRMWCKRK